MGRGVPGIGELAMFQTHTPVEALKQRVTFRWFAPRRLLRIFVFGNWISQGRQDAKIRQGKIYRRSPPSAATDGPPGRMRVWYEQFYRDGFADHPCGERGPGG